MYGQIDFAVEQGCFDFFSEEAFSFEFVKTEVLDAVALGNNDLKAHLAAQCLECIFDEMRLPQGQVASARSDADKRFSLHD